MCFFSSVCSQDESELRVCLVGGQLYLPLWSDASKDVTVIEKRRRNLRPKRVFFTSTEDFVFVSDGQPTNAPFFYGQRRWSRKSSGCRIRIPAVLRRGPRPTRAPDELLIGELSLVCFSSVCSGTCSTKKIELDGVKWHQKRIWVIGLSHIWSMLMGWKWSKITLLRIFFLIRFYLCGASPGFPNLFEVSESDWGP